MQSVIRASRGVFVSAWLFSCIVNILMLTGSLFMLQIYDRVIPSSSVPTLIALCVIVLVLYAYYGVLEFIRSRLMVRLGRRMSDIQRASLPVQFHFPDDHPCAGWRRLLQRAIIAVASESELCELPERFLSLVMKLTTPNTAQQDFPRNPNDHLI